MLPSASSLFGAGARVVVALARRHGDHSCAVIRRVLRAHAVRCCLALRRALPAAAAVYQRLHAVAAPRATSAVAARRAQTASPP